MDYYQQGKSALEAQQFFEAENYFRKALKSSASELKEEILTILFSIVKVTRPDEAWREARNLMQSKLRQKNWKQLLIELDEIEPQIPIERRAFIYEIRSEALYQLGQYGEARRVSADHFEYLLRKRLLPDMLRLASQYRARFPLTLLFYFHEVTARVQAHDFRECQLAVQRLLDVMETRWHQLEDVTGRTRGVLLGELVALIQSFDSRNGEAALLGHYCRLTFLKETRQPLERDDWKKLTELIIHNRNWRNWKLALEIAIAAQDNALSELLHEQIKNTKGFSFVKFTRHSPALKAWLLERGHNRSTTSGQASHHEKLELGDLQLDQSVQALSPAEGLSSFTMGEEEQAAEESALRQLRLNPPPLDLVPDLIVTYEMMSFSRIVDWLIGTFIHSESYPRVQKKIRYLSVMRDMRKKDYHHALATIAEMLGDSEITVDELKELRYAEGAIYHALGEKSQALRLFAEVEKIDPGYRRLRERNW